MSDDLDAQSMTLLPPGCEMIQSKEIVYIKFPSEDDAIIFVELMREMMEP